MILPAHLYIYVLHLLPPDGRLLRSVRKAAWTSALPQHCKACIVKTINDILSRLIDPKMNTTRLPAAAQLEKMIEHAHEGAPSRFKRRIVEAQRMHIYSICVSFRGKWLRNVPGSFITAELAMAAVRQDGAALRWVPGLLITASLAMAAVQQNGHALQWAPGHLRSVERFAMAAVRQTHNALPHVLGKAKTPGVCKAAALAELRARLADTSLPFAR